MENEWLSVEFDVLPYKETGTYILKSPDEAFQLLDDHIVMTQSMSFSPFKKAFEAQINTWESKLRMTQVHTHTHTHIRSCSLCDLIHCHMFCWCPLLMSAGCARGMVDMPALLAVPWAHLQLRWHKPATACGRKKIPANGANMEESHEKCL